MTAGEVRGTLEHLADQIVSANAGRHVVLLGIQRRGIPMAQRMAKLIGARTRTTAAGDPGYQSLPR